MTRIRVAVTRIRFRQAHRDGCRCAPPPPPRSARAFRAGCRVRTRAHAGPEAAPQHPPQPSARGAWTAERRAVLRRRTVPAAAARRKGAAAAAARSGGPEGGGAWGLRSPGGPALQAAGSAATTRPATGPAAGGGSGGGRAARGCGGGSPRCTLSPRRNTDPAAGRRRPRGARRSSGCPPRLMRGWRRRWAGVRPAAPRPPGGAGMFGITSNTLVQSSQSLSGPAGGASDGCGLGPPVYDYRGRGTEPGTPSHRYGRIHPYVRYAPPPVPIGSGETGGPESARDGTAMDASPA